MPPVLAIPTLGKPHLEQCLTSIDIPVRLLIIGNGEVDYCMLDEVTADWEYDYWVLDPPNNLGVAASWNLAIKCYPSEPSWLIANDDTVFAPDELQQLLDDERDWVGVIDWRVFKITAQAIERVGWFDEDFAPIYCEDADYERRCDLAGVRWGFIEGETTHDGSACLRDHRRDNDRTFPRNVQHYRDKWNVGVRGRGGYDTPFDGRLPVAGGPSLRRLRAAVWDVHR